MTADPLDRASAETDPANPMLVIISGPSGVGKDTIIEALQKRGHLPAYHYVVTCTTRPRRENEIDGVSYIFRTGTARHGPASGTPWRAASTPSSRSTSRVRRS